MKTIPASILSPVLIGPHFPPSTNAISPLPIVRTKTSFIELQIIPSPHLQQRSNKEYCSGKIKHITTSYNACDSS